jgi:hypothetical protein
MNTYVVMASNDKERYNKEMVLYKETKSETKAETNEDDEDETDEDEAKTETETKTKTKTKTETETKVDIKPKKSSNYMNYCTALRPTVRKENPNLKGVDVTMKLKEMWGELSQEDRDEYQ